MRVLSGTVGFSNVVSDCTSQPLFAGLHLRPHAACFLSQQLLQTQLHKDETSLKGMSRDLTLSGNYLRVVGCTVSNR